MALLGAFAPSALAAAPGGSGLRARPATRAVAPWRRAWRRGTAFFLRLGQPVDVRAGRAGLGCPGVRGGGLV
eukprot:5700420-Lingulodinium_polyedra.AAC.1